MIQIGPLYGYRLWIVRDGAVRSLCVGNLHPDPFEGLAEWPLEPTPAVYVGTGEPAPSKHGNDGWAASKERPWFGDRGRFGLVPGVGFAGDVAGRVEVWGEVIEGPKGFRAEYMAPTHLTEPVPTCGKGAMDVLLAFAAAWGATICTLEELP